VVNHRDNRPASPLGSQAVSQLHLQGSLQVSHPHSQLFSRQGSPVGCLLANQHPNLVVNPRANRWVGLRDNQRGYPLGNLQSNQLSNQHSNLHSNQHSNQLSNQHSNPQSNLLPLLQRLFFFAPWVDEKLGERSKLWNTPNSLSAVRFDGGRNSRAS
jgi:hypothetical protein